ncbi:OmpA family protein [bacterium LRH843]|nr:OmpA family protein [bacterium LRH843]
MRHYLSMFMILGLSLFLIVGCSSDVSDNASSVPSDEEAEDVQKVENEPQQEEEMSEDVEEEKEEETKEEIEEPDQEEAGRRLGDYNVYLGGQMIETEEKIIIEGESNLLPGARVVGEVTAGDDQFFADTTELVKEDGSFYMEIAHHNLDEETNVLIKFHFDSPQDDGIKRHYGDRGQKIEGPYVYKHQRAAGGRSPKDIYQKAEVQASFAPGEEKAIRQFGEPDFYPTPEDLGNPRVWIEVDDINNDENYFYLHGRSNLLEGSKIRGIYHYKTDEARVKPDGSFDLKIDYEYRENTPFMIEFDPNSLQWNMVEEVYGKEGQNLVGDLVVTNKYNNKQKIEKKVELKSTEIHVPDNVEMTIDGTEVTMLVPDHLLFGFDEYALKDEAKETLNEISKTLDSFNKELDIVINGHTDNIGDKDYNLKLSQQRAEEVKAYLVNQGIVQDSTITTEGYGETKPVASNDDETGQAKNRRVEIVINLR